MDIYAINLYHVLVTSPAASTSFWYHDMFLKYQNINKLGLTVNFCWFQVPLHLKSDLFISAEDKFLASSSSRQSLIQTDFFWVLVCVCLHVNRGTDGYDKFLFVHIRGHAVWQMALLQISVNFLPVSFFPVIGHHMAQREQV